MTKTILLFVLPLILFACSKNDSGSNSRPQSPSITSFTPDAGTNGTEVTISGTNFSASPANDIVKFNGLSATVKSATDTSIIATAPTGVTTGKITVTVNGSTASSPTDFVVLTGTWVRKADYGGSARYGASGFSIGGKAYIIGGGNIAYQWETDFWEYDTASNQWTQKGNFPGLGRQWAVAFTIGNKGYFGVGFNNWGQYNNDFWEYDPALDQWTKKADFPGTGWSRTEAIGFGFSDAGFVGLGSIPPFHSTVFKDMWKYSPATNTWTSAGDVPVTAYWGISATNTSDKGFVFFGSGSIEGTNEGWMFDPATEGWSSINNVPASPRVNGVAFAIGSKIYVGFGSNNISAVYGDLWEMDVATTQWQRKADFPGPARASLFGFSIGNHGYIGTGYAEGGSVKDFWQFTP